MLPRLEYLPPLSPDTARFCTIGYIDGNLTREEIRRAASSSDAYHEWERRTSPDNGRTWSPLEPLAGVVQDLPGGGVVTYPCGSQFEPVLGRRYDRLMRRVWPGNPPYTFVWKNHEHPFNDHTFAVETGADGTRTERLLRYEDGPDWDPDKPFDDEFCQTNRAYHGVTFAFAPDGAVYYPLSCHPKDRPGHNEGGIVLMRRDPGTGQWSASNQVHVTPEQSSRGLLEPDAAVLTDGTVLIVARGSNTDTTPGRKWFTTSRDNGRTLEPVREFAYDDGDLFYSPSSIHTFLRSSRNGRLYWLANICAEPPSGNMPRHPLYIAEIDEAVSTETGPAVRRDTLQLVDERGPGDGDKLQLSNFSVLEDRESGDIEIYLTRLGKTDEAFRDAEVVCYTFSPPG